MSGRVLEIIHVIVVLQTFWTHAEVFTSVARVMALSSLENKVIDHMEKILYVSGQNGESGKLVDDMQRKTPSSKHRQQSCSNPVVGFTYLRRLVREWNLVNRLVSKSSSSNCRRLTVIRFCNVAISSVTENIIAMFDVLSKWQNWPQKIDVTGAALGLLTIGQIYDLFPSPSWLDRLTSTDCSKQIIQSKYTMLTHDQFLSLLHQRRLYNNSKSDISETRKDTEKNGSVLW
ncbi:unnamed protein product, partial [Candidula unifasciata]